MKIEQPEYFKQHGIANKLQKRSLLIAVNLVAGLSIFFFGYDQGVMGGVNSNRNYAETMKWGRWNPVTHEVNAYNPIKQGGINAVYYLPGTLVGALWGGWMGDKYGRIFTIGFASVWTIIGAALQCSAQDATWMFCSRVFTGIGTGLLNAITPVWATETASHTSRGAFVSIEFTLNIFGVVVAYWIEYGTSFYGDPTGNSAFIWRFPIAFQIVPLVGLFFIIWFMPESPRWLVKEGQDEQARFILQRLRGDEDGQAEAEFQDIKNTVMLEKDTAQRTDYIAMIFGIKQGKLHTARRIQLVIWLQILQEWIGIAGITIYGPEILALAGVSPQDRQWVAGLNDITYMLSTLICVFTLDRIGRRWTLYWGAVGQGVIVIIAGGLAYATNNAADGTTYKTQTGGATVACVFIFTMIFGATWLTVPWLYPAEIFPLQIRAKGNAMGVVGWSIGNGWCVLLLPTIFHNIGTNVFYVFGAVNFISIVVVWALYPETNQRTLEEMNLVFASDSIWNWKAEENYRRLVEENPELVQAARRGSVPIDPETGLPKVDGEKGGRRPSLVSNTDGQRKFSLADKKE